MKTKQFNGLTNAEAERVAILLEECGEVIQICGKILRHGFESHNPFDLSKTTNRKLLTKELADVTFALKLMVSNNDVSQEDITEMTSIKEFRVQKYLHHQKG